MINSDKNIVTSDLITRLETTFSGKPWYGNSVLTIINRHKGPLPVEALKLINHIVAWKNFVSECLQGREEKIHLNTSKDWPSVASSSGETVGSLLDAQERLEKAIRAFDNSKWNTKSPEGKFTYLQLCHGVIDHDIYHLGQIALLLK